MRSVGLVWANLSVHTFFSVELPPPLTLLELHVALQSKDYNSTFKPGRQDILRDQKSEIGLREFFRKKCCSICPLHGKILIHSPADMSDYRTRARTYTKQEVQIDWHYLGIAKWDSNVATRIKRLQSVRNSIDLDCARSLIFMLVPDMCKNILMDFTFHPMFLQVKAKLYSTGAIQFCFWINIMSVLSLAVSTSAKWFVMF